MIKNYTFLSLLFCCFISCQPAIEKYGKAYQKTNDITALKKVIAEMPLGSDTTYVQKILGEPIDMGFDYRYLTALTGENECVIGAVLHLDEFGKVDDKWVGEICE